MDECNQPVRVLDLPSFDRTDFHRRWKRARLAALRSCLPSGEKHAPDDDELTLLKLVRAEDRERMLKAVFDNSRSLGISLSRLQRLSWEVSDLRDVLGRDVSENEELHCLQGAWEKRPTAQILRRTWCRVPNEVRPLFCDFSREAIDGLVMGISVEARFARHRSRGHGDGECVDVFFEEDQAQHRWADVPDETRARLAPLIERFARRDAHICLEGLAEGVLYYRLEIPSKLNCGPGGKIVQSDFERQASLVLPNLRLSEISPVAVLSEAN